MRTTPAGNMNPE